MSEAIALNISMLYLGEQEYQLIYKQCIDGKTVVINSEGVAPCRYDKENMVISRASQIQNHRGLYKAIPAFESDSIIIEIDGDKKAVYSLRRGVLYEQMNAGIFVKQFRFSEKKEVIEEKD